MNAIKNFNQIIFLLGLIGCLGFSSCDDDDDNATTIVVWKVDLNTKLENPSIANRPETGLLEMALLSDNSLSYAFRVNNLSSGDVLAMAHIHAGDPLTNGPVVLNFNPTFSGNTGSGTLMLRPTLVDSLLNPEIELYFNVHSQQVPGGLVRGQVNSDILLASDISLNGTNEIPSVQTTATGMAAIRLATNKKLYYSVSVNALEASDALTMSHIHVGGSTTVSGPVLVPLYDNAADFGMKKILLLETETIAKLLNDSTYVNVHSTAHGLGLIRGQVKNESLYHHTAY